MKPEVDESLRHIMGWLLMGVAPSVSDDYERASVSMLAMLSAFMAEEFDRAAEIRVGENRAMQEIFSAATTVVKESVLRRRLSEASSNTDSLRLSALNAANAELKKLLIDLQGHLEQRDDDEAVCINRAIWRALKTFSQRRAFALPI